MQVIYNGRAVDSDNFRVVLHHKDGFMRVAEGWEDYQNLLKSGEWFERIRDIPKQPTVANKRRRKVKAANDANSS